MATRIYKDPADFDARQGHFTIEVVDSRYYLRIGALNSEDRRLIGSLIDDGFVGFFQDDVRIGIAGIVSIYDAENDRIEIDSELPELQIEDEYVIRFTQSRPGEDGDGGIGTPGEDGEHAEIEIEDTDSGIRVRGKSGGEPAFGPWHDVRDGIDGEDGRDGTNGEGCLKRVIFSDHDGSENRNSVTLPEDYEDFDEIYIAVFRNYTRVGKYSIATIQNATNPRVQGVTFTFDTITRALRISGTGNFREVTLVGCDGDEVSETESGEIPAPIGFQYYIPGNPAGQRVGANGNADISYRSGKGYWYKVKGSDLVFFCHQFRLNVNRNMTQIRVFFAPFDGASRIDLVSGVAHEQGNPQNFGANVSYGDGNGDGQYGDAVAVEVSDPSGAGQRFDGVIGVSAAYQIEA